MVRTTSSQSASNRAELNQWNGVREAPFEGRVCYCKLIPRTMYAFTAGKVGRRFLGCPKPSTYQCGYFDWLDLTMTPKEIEFGNIVYNKLKRHESQNEALQAQLHSMMIEREGLASSNNELKMKLKVMEDLKMNRGSNVMMGFVVAALLCVVWVIVRE